MRCLFCPAGERAYHGFKQLSRVEIVITLIPNPAFNQKLKSPKGETVQTKVPDPPNRHDVRSWYDVNRLGSAGGRTNACYTKPERYSKPKSSTVTCWGERSE
jgi:hypothetical protein